MSVPSLSSDTESDVRSLNRSVTWSSLIPQLRPKHPTSIISSGSRGLFSDGPSRMHPIFLNFSSPELEIRYCDHKYGKRRNIVYSIAFFVGVLVLAFFIVTQDLQTDLSVIWPISRGLVGAWLLVSGVMFLIPFVMTRKALLETILVLSYVLLEFRFTVRDLWIQEFELPFGALKSGVTYFQVAFQVILCPRVIVSMVSLLCSSILFTLTLPIWYFLVYKSGNVSDWNYEPFTSLAGYWFESFLILIAVYFVGRTDRSLFVLRMELEEREKEIRKESKRGMDLLRNIFPEKFIHSILRGKLEENGREIVALNSPVPVGDEDVQMKGKRVLTGEDAEEEEGIELGKGKIITASTRFRVGCIIESLADGCILEADLVNFTLWARLADPNLVTRVINAYYSVFDLVAKRLQIEKIRTLGDSWIGFAIDKRDWRRIVGLAVCMVQAVREVNKMVNEFEQEEVVQLRLRVGVAAGHRLYLAIQGSLQANISFDAFGHLSELVVQLEQSADQDGIRMSSALAAVVKDTFVVEDCALDSGETGGEILVGENWTDVISSQSLSEELTLRIKRALSQTRKEWKEKGHDRAPLKQSVRAESTFLERRTSTRDSEAVPAVTTCWRRFSSAAKTKLKGCCVCLSPMGLIYPLATFRSPKDEWSCQEEVFQNTRGGNVVFFLYPLLMNLILVIMCATSSVELLWNGNPFVFSVYVVVLVEFILSCFLIVVNFRRRVPYTFFLLAFWSHVLLFEGESILAMLYGPVPVVTRYYLYLNHFIFMTFDASTIPLLRFLIFFVDNILVLVDVGIVNWIGVNPFIETLSVMLVAWFTLFFGVLKKELSIKKCYESRGDIVRRTAALAAEKGQNENVLQSILPRPVLELLFHLHGRTFTSRMTDLFVCFMSVQNIPPRKHDPIVGNDEADLELEEIEHMVMFLTSVHHHFDVVLANDIRCIQVKRCTNSYIWISKTGGIDALIGCLEVIGHCVTTFQRCSDWSFGTDEKAELMIGLAYGRFHSGVFGRTRTYDSSLTFTTLSGFLFDILGDKVNLSARLCQSSIPERATVCVPNIQNILERAPPEKSKKILLEPRGRILLKGIGNKECSFISIQGSEAAVE